jgi:HK97 family phage prohead protease
MERKNLAFKLDQGSEGKVSAVFATFDVIDKHGDITPSGAFTDGEKVLISAYGHESWWGAMPVGKGVISQTKTEAIFEGEFFLNTTAGRDTYEMVKGTGDLQEWSYGFDILKHSYEKREDSDRDVRILEKLKVFEVSPVLIGAGVNTRTLAVKSALPFGDHADATLAEVSAFVARTKSLADLRAKDDRTLSHTNLERLKTLKGEMLEALNNLDLLLKTADPADNSAALEVFTLYQKTRAQLAQYRA